MSALSHLYGANEDMEEWVKRRGLRYSPRGRCLHWISKGRCGVTLCREGHGAYQWMDHVSGWIDQDGKRMLLSQPYHLDNDFRDGIGTLIRACEKFELSVTIHGTGWYGHGTIAIELRPREEIKSQ